MTQPEQGPDPVNDPSSDLPLKPWQKQATTVEWIATSPTNSDDLAESVPTPED